MLNSINLPRPPVLPLGSGNVVRRSPNTDRHGTLEPLLQIYSNRAVDG
jgi:hypothetical protein